MVEQYSGDEEDQLSLDLSREMGTERGFRSRRKLLPGIHPKIANERLGHSKIGITLDLYSHVLPGMQAEAAAAVDGALQAAQQRRTQMLANRLQSPSVLVYENKKP